MLSLREKALHKLAIRRRFSLDVCQLIDDDLLIVRVDTENFLVNLVDKKDFCILPKNYRKVLNQSSVREKYLIRYDDIFHVLTSLQSFKRLHALTTLHAIHLEKQNQRWWPLRYLYFFRYKSDISKFIVTDRYLNLLDYSLLLDPDNLAIEIDKAGKTVPWPKSY